MVSKKDMALPSWNLQSFRRGNLINERSIPDVQHILIEKLGLSVFHLCKQEGFVVNGNLSLGLAFKSVSNKSFLKKATSKHHKFQTS